MREIRIRWWQHVDTGLVRATSPDITGLVAHGHSREEVRPRLRGLVADLLSLSGDDEPFELVEHPARSA